MALLASGWAYFAVRRDRRREAEVYAREVEEWARRPVLRHREGGVLVDTDADTDTEVDEKTIK